jgi:TolB-like protein
VIPDIFLSYTREDQAMAKRFAEAFEAQGFSVWWDVTLRSGEAYDEVTEEALKTAKAVVVLWSKKSVVSRWVRAEATLADRNRTLVPARIEVCDLPIMFELTQTADLSHCTGAASDPAWRSFLTDVRRFVEAKAEPVRHTAPVVASSPPPREARPSLAVLPFINRAGRGEDDVFADGMVEDLTAAISLSRRMKVIAPSATASYRMGARDLRQIGRDLGVRYLLEGNVRRVGDSLRVTAQLVEAEDGNILWTQKFDRPLAELAALQEDLVTEVAAHLGAQVDRAEIEHALRKPGDITAWEAVLRASPHLARSTPSGAQAAAAEARRALEIDPHYDLAHATLALALGQLFVLRGRDDAELAQEALVSAARAQALESSDAIVLARIAAALDFVGKYQDALPFAERAVSLNPNLEIPRFALGTTLHKLGRWDEAIAQFDATERLAPAGYWAHTAPFISAMAHLSAGRTERALELADRSLGRGYTDAAQIVKIVCLAKLGDSVSAHQSLRHLRTMSPDMSKSLFEKRLRTSLFDTMSPAQIEEHVAAFRQLWDDVASESKSA